MLEVSVQGERRHRPPQLTGDDALGVGAPVFEPTCRRRPGVGDKEQIQQHYPNGKRHI